MAVCGFMNTGGNLGGIIGLPIVGYFSDHHSWHTAFIIGIGFALASALSWLGIEVTEAGDSPAPELAPRAANT